jgi:hypothetical protein
LVIRAINKITGYTFTMPTWIKYIGLGAIAGKTYSFRDVIPEIKQIEVGKETTALTQQEAYMKSMAQLNATTANLASAVASGAFTDEQVAKAMAQLNQDKNNLTARARAAGVGKYNGGKIGSYMKGGVLYGSGGLTRGFAQQGIPVILHGGEYVISRKAVQRIGTDVLDQINSMRLSKPNMPTMPSVPEIIMPNMRITNNNMQPSGQISNTENINIYVDNFIGEPQWFQSMMKEYNTKVLPRNTKTAGLENRIISTYTGINRGL